MSLVRDETLSLCFPGCLVFPRRLEGGFLGRNMLTGA